MTVPRICMLAERQVGIGSAAGALEGHARARDGVLWTDVTYHAPGGFLERLPLPAQWVGTLRGFLQTGAALRQGPFDALFFLTHNPAVLHRGALRRAPTLLWTDVTPSLLDELADQYGHAVGRNPLLRAFKRRQVQQTFAAAALCVGWSEWARRSFVRDYGVPEHKTAVVPPGVNLTLWSAPVRAVSEGLPRLLFVGGDFARKGGDLLLEVFRAHLRGRCLLDIVTRDAVQPEPGVSVHRGLVAGSPALLSLYRAADAFVLPTRGDCYSIASLEAMAMGLPVVVSDVGGIADIVEDGATGRLIPPGDGPALRAALDWLLADRGRLRELGLRGRARAERKFDARTTSEELLGLLARMAALGGAGTGRA